MYFLYFHIILCYSIIILRVNSYVLLAGNIDDFRKIARKFMPDDFVEQIEQNMVRDTSFRGYREPVKDDEETDEDSDESQQDSLELITEALKTAMTKEKPITRYNFKKSAPPFSPIPPQRPAEPQILPFVVPPGLTLDDIVEKVKQRLEEELINRSALANAQALNAQTSDAQASYAQPVNVPQAINPPIYKSVQNTKLTDANAQVQSPVYDYKAPLNVVKEEIIYEATYEESDDKVEKPEGQNHGLVIQPQPKTTHNVLVTNSQPQLVQKTQVDISRPKNVLPLTENRLVNPKQEGGLKKIRYIKQVVEPAKSIQEQSSYIQQPRMVQQPSLVQQLNRTAQLKVLKNKQLVHPTPQTALTLPTPQSSEEAIDSEAFDMHKSNDSYENDVTSPKEETFEREEAEATTLKSLVKKYNITTKTPSVPTVAEEEKSTEEEEDVQDPAEAAKYDSDATEATKKSKVKTESISYEEQETKPNPKTTTHVKVTVLDKTTKKSKIGTIRAQSMINSPNPYSKLPTLAAKYVFNAQVPEADMEPDDLKPTGTPSARFGKVKLL